ncbi:MAG TPA: S8 family peptidase, partial [Chitinophagales bacterium]|nr:S8 family peptidase [Chitinophagales bacterium]
KAFATTSLGPTRDNRMKPDISATGSTILCTGDSNDIALSIHSGNGYKVAADGKHKRNGGTSMSSPIVAGIAALYLQKRPTAWWNEVKQALICTAVQDSFTGTVPNYTYGYGKVNAFQMLTHQCFVYGATDTGCLNYNPLATLDTGGCVPKVYGCTDSAALNYSASANVNDNSCLYAVAIRNLDGTHIALAVMPNPFNNQTTFSFVNDGYAFKQGEIEIVNQLGSVADKLAIGQNSGNYVYNNTKLAAGIYFYRLKLDSKVVKTGKLVVE